MRADECTAKAMTIKSKRCGYNDCWVTHNPTAGTAALATSDALRL